MIEIITIGIITVTTIYLLIKINSKRCPNCRAKINEDNLRKLKTYDRFTCHNCGKTIYEE